MHAGVLAWAGRRMGLIHEAVGGPEPLDTRIVILGQVRQGH
jgi:hypothetical protein